MMVEWCPRGATISYSDQTTRDEHQTMNPADYAWVEDATVTRTRTFIWRTVAGLHYEAPTPQSPYDVPERYSEKVVRTGGIILGSHPELGDIYMANGEPVTTRLHSETTRTGWTNCK